MTIVKQHLISQKDRKLPAAHIYLDDLQEIINILKPGDDEQPPKLKFTVGDLTCDTIEELRQIRKERTSDFKMSVRWQKEYIHDQLEVDPHFRAELWPDGSPQRRAWVLSQVRDIFKRRSNKLKTWFLVLMIFVVFAGVFEILMHFVHKTVGREGNVHSLVVWGYGLLAGYPIASLFSRFALRSVVIFQSSDEQKGSWFQRNKDQILLHAVNSIISAVIGAAIGAAIALFAKQH